MDTQLNTKVRLVKCPGCRRVLPESPDVPVYKCGGCGTILLAKNRKLETNNTKLSSQEADSVAKSQHDHDLSGSPSVESLPDKESIRHQDEEHDCMELCQGTSVSDGLSSSPDITCCRSEDSPIQAKESPEYSPLSQNREGHQRELHDDNGEWTAGPNFSNELLTSGEITREDEADTKEASEDVEEHSHQDNRVDHKEDGETQRVWPESDIDEVQNFSEHEDQEGVLTETIEDNYVPPRNNEKSQTCSVDQNGGIIHAGFAPDNGSDSIIASRGPLNGSLVSFYLTSDDEHLDRSPSEVAHDFERVSSVDTLRSSYLADLMPNYPTNGSYYAYDGSESSYDGTDDLIRERIPHPSRKNKDVGYIRTTEMLRKDGFRGNNMIYSEPERSHWNSQGKSTETNRYTDGHRMRLDKSRDPVACHRVVRNLGYQHGLLPPCPPFNLSDKPSYSEPDKIDLLRTVCELKDQLNRMQFPKATSDRKFTPHYDHLAPDRDMYNPRHHHAERCNASRLAFSGEAAHYRHQVSCSCLHCCPQERHYSAQLPSHDVHCRNSCCNTSNSLSPHHYTNSTKVDNQRLHEMRRLHLRERYHTAKRHLRPIAGGAPIVACYHCSELLQLPADFLLFKRRYHRLMCNACKKVLKFSLIRGTYIVPYIPDASSAPPPSEADDYNNATRQRNLEPPSRSISYQHGEPISCSDDYGPSFCRSYSTEGEASVMLPSLARVDKKSYNRKMSSGTMEDRKMKGIFKKPQNKNEGSSNSAESVGPSSRTPTWRKVTSEIEELEPSSNSPLHRLMGYSSPSKVLYR